MDPPEQEPDMNLAEVFENALTAEEWWDEFNSNACCPDSIVAARRLCGCGGSAAIPAGISRLLLRDPEEV
ncbi:hypothetical protein I5G58_gp002 [Mycobacterium phage BirdsNest]|uniref:Uncharacterized protein n=1 Tax=Mycobacterium phage BirdsNest TaxID=2686231 RepID=A0A6B9LHK3_9CAUD|nr:hypothetical protein I5G58_gp002 [Mycobacterium phage BirdsNest]QHB37304.1 hypothetical protein PBI_BIRDSNEST_2 [Mycobacterium phage BirdsNest]